MKSIIIYTYMFLLMFFATMIMTSIYNVGKEKQNVNYILDAEEGNDSKSKKSSSTFDDFLQHILVNTISLKTKVVKMLYAFISMYDYFHLNEILQPPQFIF